MSYCVTTDTCPLCETPGSAEWSIPAMGQYGWACLSCETFWWYTNPGTGDGAKGHRPLAMTYAPGWATAMASTRRVIDAVKEAQA